CTRGEGAIGAEYFDFW
nr:immunoglobulin heavy chain junction region [Macaca mulatta]MOX04959.1 immunoglobulin heavy chain junction region [Macaca mulatta]MOX05554.1 immunoglobulin heavy chain junction region [Macaca mulatta]MOX06282.1 immunoglobulin heavy chain junction region [Macaca mulatta]